MQTRCIGAVKDKHLKERVEDKMTTYLSTTIDGKFPAFSGTQEDFLKQHMQDDQGAFIASCLDEMKKYCGKLLTNPFEWYENAPSLQLPGSGSTPDDAEEKVITTTTAQTEAPETVTLKTTAAEGHLSLACSNGLDNYADECQKLCGNSLDAQLDFCH